MSFAVAIATVVFGLTLVAGASAAMVTFGSNLAAAPTLDTANGDFSNNGHYMPTETNPPPAPPLDHAAEDIGIWNTSLSGAGTQLGAPAGGQVLAIQVKGCAIRDDTAPTSPDGSQVSIQNGVPTPVNTILFQALTPPSNGNYTVPVNETSGQFLMPFCSDRAFPSSVTPSTVTTFTPIHMCLAPGDLVAFHDIGGFIPDNSLGLPSSGAGPWYPEGIPMEVLASVPGSSTASFIGFDTSTYGPGLWGPSDNTAALRAVSGFATEAGQEVMLRVVEGTGDDAYGLCPGGNAIEPTNSNTVTCVDHKTNPGDPYGTCNSQSQPVFAPVNTSPPTISGTPQVGSTVTETHGAWNNVPPGVYSRQWESCDSSGANCQAIAGATGGAYKLAAGDLGHVIVVQESAANTANIEGPISSAPTALVTAPGGTGTGTGTGTSTGTGTGCTSGCAKTLVVGKLRLSKYAFRARQGTTISYQDNLAGTTTLTLTRKDRKHAKPLWRATHHDTPGRNSVRLLDKKLRKGFSTLVITTTFPGQKSPRTSLTVRIVT